MGKKLKLKWVTDEIGDEFKKWKKGDIILLQAQTGTGKTYFIKDRLIRELKSDQKILLLCNRVNLKRQLKIDLIKKYGGEIPYLKDSDGKSLKEIDLSKLDEITSIGNVVITTYQTLQHKLLDAEYETGESCNLDVFDYVVCDESHYIFSDASFNNTCRLAYMELIYKQSKNHVKIFISATMEEIEGPIERAAERQDVKPKIYKYSTGKDYSYVNTKYFKNIIDIIKSIKNDKSEHKWLIFVTSKRDGNKIQEVLGKDVCSVIYSNKNAKELGNIINKNKFYKKVLVCTKVLDNGINLEDELLTNIVIMAWDKTTFIQELGRKRVDINNAQAINLYIPMRGKKSFISLLRNCNDEMKEIELYENDRNQFNRKYDNDISLLSKYNHLFYRENEEWQLNLLGHARLIFDRPYLIDMINKFGELGEFAFIHEQLEWLSLNDTFDKRNLIKNVISNEKIESLENYLEKIVGSRLFKEEQKELIDRIDLRDSRRRQQKSISQFNVYFETNKMGFNITSKRVRVDGKLKTVWIVGKISYDKVLSIT